MFCPIKLHFVKERICSAKNDKKNYNDCVITERTKQVSRRIRLKIFFSSVFTSTLIVRIDDKRLGDTGFFFTKGGLEIVHQKRLLRKREESQRKSRREKGRWYFW